MLDNIHLCQPAILKTETTMLTLSLLSSKEASAVTHES